MALEAAATSLGRPGLRALNVVTSTYGRWFGGWLRRAGAEVEDLAAPPGRPIGAADVAAALAGGRFGLVAIVHAESAYGILNPLEAVAALAEAPRRASRRRCRRLPRRAPARGGRARRRRRGDRAAEGARRAGRGLGLSVSPAAWERMAPRGEAPSILSLADQRALWLETGRGALSGHALGARVPCARRRHSPGSRPKGSPRSAAGTAAPPPPPAPGRGS